MALASSIAFGDQLAKGKGSDIAAGEGFLLSDQDYYNLAIRDKEQAILRRSMGQSGALSRGQRSKRSGFLTSAGLGGSTLEARGDGELEAAFRAARMRAARAAQAEGEGFRRQKFAERDANRAEAASALGTTTNVTSGLLSAIPFVGGIFSGIEQGAGAGYQAGFAAAPEYSSSRGMHETGGTAIRQDNSGLLNTVDYGTGFASQGGGSSGRTRGGGGQDFYRQFGY